MQYFFYGTLLDDIVRREILRREVPRTQMHRAVLRGFCRVYRTGATYPVLIPEAAGQVEGLLVCGLTVRDAARLAAYEGPEYGLVITMVRTEAGALADARTFLPRRPGVGSSEEWRLEDWQRRFGAPYRARIARHRQAPPPD